MDSNYSRAFGERLARVMERRGTSATELAWAVGAHVNTVRNWTSGRNLPRLDQLPEIRRSLGCSYRDLLGK